jgi:cytochrome b6-f complex iron-sulfur subunit
MGLNPYDTPRGRLHRLADLSRRQFILLMAVLASIAGSLFGGIKILGFMFPNANLEEPLAFSVDQDPDTITIGNPLQITEKRVSIVRDDGGYYAVYLICTHLGCTPNYVTNVTSGTGVPDDVAKEHGERQPSEQLPNGWACPCHGSRYFIDSTNFYGPAPRPMDWVDIQLAPDKRFVVNRGAITVYRQAGDNTVPGWRLDPKTGKDNGKTVGV